METIKKNDIETGHRLPDFPNLVLIILIVLAILFATIGANAQVENIRVVSIERLPERGYITVTTQYRLAIPNPLGASAQVKAILRSYASKFNLIDVENIGGTRYAIIQPEPEPISLPKTKAQIRTMLVNKFNQLQNGLNNLVANLEPYDSLIGEAWINNVWQISTTVDSL